MRALRQLLGSGGGYDHYDRVAVRIDGVDKKRLGDGLNLCEAALRDALTGVIGRRDGTATTGVLSWLLGDGRQNGSGCQSGSGDDNCTH